MIENVCFKICHKAKMLANITFSYYDIGGPDQHSKTEKKIK